MTELSTIGVLGAGTMGAGIAQVAAEAGFDVLVHEAAEGGFERARERIGGFLQRKAEKDELTADEARDYFDEVLRVGRAIEKQYTPIKMNFEMLGNSLPHLHTHVVPRYLDDGEPGQPPHFMRIARPDESKIPDDQYAADLAALRALLDQ